MAKIGEEINKSNRTSMSKSLIYVMMLKNVALEHNHHIIHRLV